MTPFTIRMVAAIAGFLFFLLVVRTFEVPPVDSTQIGFRGLGMEEVNNPRSERAKIAANRMPEASPPVEKANKPASAVYTNVKVLGNVDANEFLRLMTDMATWVAPPAESCNYCHNPDNLADESKYQYKVSRRMLEMTRAINGSWKSHVQTTGVTCYTCHRGQPVPPQVWFAPKPNQPIHIVGTRTIQNLASADVGLTSLPNNVYGPFLNKADDLRIVPTQALPGGTVGSMQATEETYGLMMHISQALGVNCTFCHNSRSFVSWDQSTPQRTTAWYGIRLTRDLNNSYMTPLKPLFPASRLGPTGDVAKINCDTCHEGVSKPLYGAAVLTEFPGLVGPSPAPARPPGAR
jgi:photosynthetic reaction center cytochrome c subunit